MRVGVNQGLKTLLFRASARLLGCGAHMVARRGYPLPLGAKPNAALQSDRLYTRALAFIASHLEDPTLTQEAVASHLGISARYLRRLFASNNTTFSHYLLERRLRLAHRLLSQSKDSRGRVSRIAYACGFNNCSHFTRVFNDRYGAPPRTVFQGVLVRGGK